MAGVAGFEPTNDGVRVRCLTAWRHPNGMIGNTFPTDFHFTTEVKIYQAIFSVFDKKFAFSIKIFCVRRNLAHKIGREVIECIYRS